MSHQPIVPDVLQPGELVPNTPEELQASQELTHLESVIRQSRMRMLYCTGRALRDIHQKRLYLLRADTFDDYCQQYHEMTRQRATQYMAASEVIENLSSLYGVTIGDIDDAQTVKQLDALPLPTRESQARVLAKLSKDDQLELWPEIVRSAPEKGITAAYITEKASAWKQEHGDEHEPPERAHASSSNSSTSGGTLHRTLCLFCREQDVVVYPLGETRQGMCKKCQEDAAAYFAQVTGE